MRGFVRLPDMIATRLGLSARVGEDDSTVRRRAPKAAARSQSDAVGFAQFAMSLARGRKPQEETQDDRLILPVTGENQKDHLRQTFIGKGQFLARQEQWDVLGQMIRETDRNRQTSICGHSLAGMLSLGARADAVQASRDAILAGNQPCGSIISALEEVLDENPRCWGVALTVAQAHMDIGLAWLGKRSLTGRPACDSPQFIYHFKRASDILDPYCAVEENSAILAEARCELLLGEPDAPARVADDYEDLIDLDPGNARHMRRMGVHLLPRWFGSYELLDDLAHETAERTEDIWGDGGYSWVWMDVLRAVPEAAARLDADRFIAGMHDILERRDAQSLANIMAAYSGVAMAPGFAPDDLSQDAMSVRGAIHDCLPWIIEDHLRELHPTHWAEAQFLPFATLPPHDELAEHGTVIARELISRHFHEALSTGRVVTFSPKGIRLHTPSPREEDLDDELVLE